MLLCEKVHSYFSELACQENPGTVMIQEVCLPRFKEETLRDHLVCCKWILRIIPGHKVQEGFIHHPRTHTVPQPPWFLDTQQAS